MNSNPYQHLLDQNQQQNHKQNQNQNQPTVLAEPQQQQQQQQYLPVNVQAYVYNPHQMNAQQQQAPQVPQYIPYDQCNLDAVVPMDPFSQNQQQYSSPPIVKTSGITNKNSFMFSIVLVYILQYAFQIGFVLIYTFGTSRDNIFLYDNQITIVSWLVMVLTILIPIGIFNIKSLQKNPQSVIVSIIYLIVYASFQTSLFAISNKKTYDQKGDSKFLGEFVWFGIIEAFQIAFNIQGLIQLLGLAILLKVKGDAFTFKQFKLTGAGLAIVCGIPFISWSIFIVFMAAAVGLLFTFWFSYGIDRVSNEAFGLKQEQIAFGSFSVFVVMTCPCVTKI